jgi:two-component system LytT family response regulator
MLAGVSWIECLGEVSDGAGALRAIDELQPDLVFLDIRMPGLDGLEVLRRAKHGPAVIFTTAYDRYAVTAFELAAVDYLLKPFGRERFLAALERARPALERDAGASSIARVRETLTMSPARLFVRDGGHVVPIRARDIARLEAADDAVIVHATGRRYRMNVPLHDLENRLDPSQFVRVHRSHVVNLDHVVALTPYDGSRFLIRLRDGTELKASRQRSRLLRKLGK